MEMHTATARLLAWYAADARRLPWRETRDPYAIWVAEIMLQQTRVETVIPYYQRWLQRFPDIHALASASQQEVLQAWEGLGYYSRARNLHRAAIRVENEHDGRLPSDPETLARLPGIGPSTAADILSIAFGQDAGALDGNIRRVLARLFDLPHTSGSPAFLAECRQHLNGLLPPGRAGDFNQAMMDLGAGICLPRAPLCPECPLRSDCLACSRGTQQQRPVPRVKPQIPHYIVTAGVLHANHADASSPVLIARRPADGLLGGMWEFPGGKQQPGESLEDCLKRELQEELGVTAEITVPLGSYRHAYTHFRVTLHAFHCQITRGEPQPLSADQLAWVLPSQLGTYPMGKLDRLISRDLNS